MHIFTVAMTTYIIVLSGVVVWLDTPSRWTPGPFVRGSLDPPRSIHSRITGLPPGWMDPSTLASAIDNFKASLFHNSSLYL